MRLVITLLTSFFILLSLSGFSQITKFKSTSFAYKTKSDYSDVWTKWSQLKSTEVLITIDLDNERIRIFSEKEQTYDIIRYYEIESDDEGDETLQFHCVNEAGRKCFARFVILNTQNGRRQLYIDFADMMWMYNIYKLD